MNIGYAQALQVRLRWLEWSNSDDALTLAAKTRVPGFGDVLPTYRHALAVGDTFVMNKHFCQLTDYARRSIPDDLAFDKSWLISPNGWMWVEEPFEVPRPPGLPDIPFRISAIGWSAIEGQGIIRRSDERLIIPGSVYFKVFFDPGLSVGEPTEHGFTMWSYFTIIPGDHVVEIIHNYEKTAITSPNEGDAGRYSENRQTDMLHEIRWIFTAFHLMSQKLATTVEHHPERAVRRRMERENTPIAPIIRVITLRRLEEARKEAGAEQLVDWHWQWRVTGHWRQQYYPSEKCHKIKWIEDYIKGPPDKPLKPPAHTIYGVER